MKKFVKILLVGALCAFFLVVGVWSWRDKQTVEYRDCLDEVVFSLNGQDVQMKDLGFYILYEEREVELQAQIYNPQNTRDYWNLHVDGVFVQSNAKKTILEMAIHDNFFYEKAIEDGLKLDAEEENRYRNAMGDFWMDLLDEQAENMPVSDEYINESIRKIALAEKYQRNLVKETDSSYASYNWDGAYYQKLMEEQNLTINDKLWDRITVGNITLSHKKPNYINGHNKK